LVSYSTLKISLSPVDETRLFEGIRRGPERNDEGSLSEHRNEGIAKASRNMLNGWVMLGCVRWCMNALDGVPSSV